MGGRPATETSANVWLNEGTICGGHPWSLRGGQVAMTLVESAHRTDVTRGCRASRRWMGAVVALALASAPLVAVSLVASAVPAGAASATPVIVADICSCTGPQGAQAQQTSPTLQAWASWVNAHGGLNGHPVKMTVTDDTTNPTLSIAAVQKAIQSEHVSAIFDNSNVDVAWVKMATSAGVPIIGAADSDLSYNSLDTFSPGPTLNYGDAGQEIGIARLTNFKKEAIFYCVEAAVCKSETSLDGIIGKRYGVKVVYTSGISFSAPSYAAQCVAAKQTGAEVLEIGDASTVAEKAASDCAAQGWSPIEIAAAVSSNMNSDSHFDGMLASQQEIPYFVHNAATKVFWSALDKYAPTLHLSPNFGEQSIIGWAQGVLLQDAIKAAAPSSETAVTPALVKKGLYHLPPGDNLGGIAPQAISFTKGVYANRSCWYYISVKNGKFIWGANKKPLCGYLSKPGSNEGSAFLSPKKQFEAGEAPSR
jgi:branched-chain amino acid transport system substrate-binding protein